MSRPSGEAIAAFARQALGVNYVWGGTDLRRGVDCSGLVQQVYKAFGITLPRVTYDQIGEGAAVGVDKLQPGDLVFFDTDAKKSGPDHVGIYLGAGKFIHAPRTGEKVKISSLGDSYYMQRFMGGRRMAGVENGAGTVDPYTFSGDETARASAAELAERYGMSTAMFRGNKELSGLLDQAVDGQWKTDLFTAHLKNTKWWKDTSSTNRQAQILAKSDPATYKSNMEAARLAAHDMAVQLGATLSTGAEAKLAKNIIHFGWQDAEIKHFLGKYIEFNDKHVLGGQAGQIYQQLRTEAYANGVTLGEQTLKNSAAYIVRGLSTMEQQREQIRQHAAGAYPAFADQIMAGQAVQDIAAPYAQMVAQELELPSTAVDLYNAKVKAALTAKDAQGNPAPMSLTDFQAQLRSDPAWAKTSGAANSTLATAHQVLRDMGLVGS